MEQHQLEVVGISYTDRCNMNCIHCYNDSGSECPNPLTLAKWKNLALQLKDIGVQMINFGGGECLLHKEFLSFCHFCYDLGLTLSLTSNGSLVTELGDDLQLFSDIGISIDSADRQTHDTIRQYDGAFRIALNSLRYLVEHRVETEIVTCLNSKNCDHKSLTNLYNLCKEIKVGHWRLNTFKLSGRGKDYRRELEMTPEQLRDAVFHFKNLNNNHVTSSDPVIVALCGTNYTGIGCPCGTSSCRIKANGDVLPCVYVDVPVGNIREQPIFEIWNKGQIFHKMRNRDLTNAKCAKCGYFDLCKGGCAGSAFLRFGHFNAPDPMCWFDPNKDSEINRQEMGSEQKTSHVHEKYLCTLYIPISNEKDRSSAKAEE